MRPPYFPVRVTDLIGTVNFHTIGEDDLAVGDAKLKVRSVPHIGLTYGYRIEVEGASIAYISDHQQPTEGGFRVSDEVLELADGADLVIHDAQYSDEEFALKPHWGHCTADYALRVAAEAGARRVVLFHHDPSHDDDSVDRLVERSNELGARLDLTEVLAASEGLTVALGPVSAALR